MGEKEVDFFSQIIAEICSECEYNDYHVITNENYEDKVVFRVLDGESYSRVKITIEKLEDLEAE